MFLCGMRISSDNKSVAKVTTVAEKFSAGLNRTLPGDVSTGAINCIRQAEFNRWAHLTVMPTL